MLANEARERYAPAMTICCYLSSPVGRLALEVEVPLHVDGCLGGWILPFGEQLGYDIPAFDFRVPGVTTISADTHKYGYSFKGTSTLLFRDKAYRNAQYFELVGWSGVGTRSQVRVGLRPSDIRPNGHSWDPCEMPK